MLNIGYPIKGDALDLELYELFCMFGGSRELGAVAAAHPGIHRLCERFQQSEAARRLLLVAATIRNGFDAGTYNRAKQGEKVGTLCTDLSKVNTWGDLTFRESCNKILHADRVELTELLEGKPPMLKYSFILQGLKKKEEWQAELDVLRFIDVASKSQ